MPRCNRYRILTPGGFLSRDTFVVSPRQPLGVEPGCVVVVHVRTGGRLTIHDTRLFPAEMGASVTVLQEPRQVCTRCGRVEGVAEDLVRCRQLPNETCGLTPGRLRG